MSDIEKNTHHPSHYNKEGKKECWDIMTDLFGREITFGFCIGSAYKYAYRAGYKEGNPREQDVAKIKEYIKKAEELRKTMYEEDLLIILKDAIEKAGIYGREE